MKKDKILEFHENKKLENKGSMLKAIENLQETKNKKDKIVELLEQANQKLDLLLSIVGGNK